MYSELAPCVAPEKHLFPVSTTHFHLDWNWHSPWKIYVDFYCCFLSSAEGSPYVLRATELYMYIIQLYKYTYNIHVYTYKYIQTRGWSLCEF